MAKSWFRVMLMLCLSALLTLPAWSVDPTKRIHQYAHTAWRTSEGIFDSPPTAFAQTKDGYLWIGSASSLLRFDGVRFVKFTDAQGTKLASNSVFSLLTDRDGSLWIGTSLGLSHLKDGVLTNLTSSRAGIRGIAQDDAGAIWVARANMLDPGGGALCKVEGDALQCFGPAQGVQMPFAATVVCDHEGNVWLGGAQTYTRWNPKSQTVYAPETFKNNADNAAIGAMGIAPNGHVLVGMTKTGPEVGLQEIIDGQPHPYGPIEGLNSEKDILANVIHADAHGALWLGTQAGIIRVYKGVVDRYELTDGLSGPYVMDLFEDQEGDLWVITTEGIDRFRDLPVTSFGVPDGMASEISHSVLADRSGRLLVADGFRLSILQNNGIITAEQDKVISGKGQVPMVFQAADGSFWMSAANQLYRYDRGKLLTIARPKDAPPNTETKGLAEDRDGDIYALQGLNPDLWKVRKGIATRVVTSPELPPAHTMTMDHQGTLWFGLASGKLARLRGTSLDFIEVEPPGKPHSFIRQVTARDDTILSSSTFGLMVYRDGKVSYLGKTAGLPCESIFSFTFDLSGNLWMASACGTMEVFSQEWQAWRSGTRTSVTPRVLDGLDGARFANYPTIHAADVTLDGKVWFATGAELQMVDPANLAINTVVPQVHIESVLADGVAMDAVSSPRLPPLTRQLQVDYTATSLSLPQRVLFRYKLEGHDKDWQSVGTRRQAFYNDLKPGTYHFTVLACNNSGLWNEVGSSITFTVAPAWFQTRWFMVVCAFLAGLLLYGLYWLRVRQLRKHLQIQYETRLEERTRVARDLHDTLLQTIQGTKLVAEEALLGGNDSAQLRNIVARIHDWLSRAVIEGRAALTALRTESSAGDLVEKFRSAAEECCEGSAMTLRFETSGVPMELGADVTEEIFRIGYEAIRNSVAHSGGSLLEVQLVYGKVFKLRVRDNGIGFDADASSGRVSGHYGIEGMKERAAGLGGVLSVRSLPGSGTEISLTKTIG
ncbi:sensor histidine kinase [Granulicella arctica]|uniref:sensor histidine kinase n=1 Tax=Granulicella arctica TaxID=940613 RepID=UPI0021E0643A|nr:sensor histidine kinase [Granulicella arctica]